MHLDGRPVQFFAKDIDPDIQVIGQAQSAEPVLWLTLKPDTVLGLANSVTGNPNWVKPHVVEPRWRSITQSLSVTGIDLTRTEYLEFWVWEDGRRTARADRAAVLLDFGAVFEDALACEPDSFTVVNGDTTYYGQRSVGVSTPSATPSAAPGTPRSTTRACSATASRTPSRTRPPGR